MSIDLVETALAEQGYVAERRLATAVYLALELEQPLLLEGEAGVGKTELAKAIAKASERPLVRLQCYEGLDRQSALYDWDYARQILHIRVMEAAAGKDHSDSWRENLERELYSERFLLKRPLLAAITPDGSAPVLLIDEVDRADAEFEAFLLELLAEFQVTIPEYGTIRAKEKPAIILTSNRTRDMHDALKRRCLYQWVDFPSFEKECRIVGMRVPGLGEAVTRRACAFVEALRQQPLQKLPGVAETVNWAQALAALGAKQLDTDIVTQTLGCLLKYREDIAALERSQADLQDLLRQGGMGR